MNERDKFCPLQTLLPCGPKCGFYSKLDKRCSINLLAEALIALVDVRGRVFTSKIRTPGQVTIPADIRKELKLRDGTKIRMVIARETEK